MTFSQLRLMQQIFSKNLEHRLDISLFSKKEKTKRNLIRTSQFRYLARLYLSESLLSMNKIELALNQLDADVIKNETDLSFKISLPTVDKGNDFIKTPAERLLFC